MRGRDVIPAVFLVVCAVAGVVGATRLPIGTVNQPGPGFFPLALATGLLLASLALVVQGILPRATARATRAPVERRAWGKVVAVVTALFLYGFLMDAVGFTIATFLLLAFLFLVVKPTRWGIAVGGSALTVIVCWVVFKMWLGMQLPVGPWGF